MKKSGKADHPIKRAALVEVDTMLRAHGYQRLRDGTYRRRATRKRKKKRLP